ncbi:MULTISPECIES: copper resistance D family protein [Roseobacteraceae]|jgi:putative copper resistance protein D|uniref:copper resistance D family protein n=1 Tax=Rhodobacterales TaxID=204455 RepID=UPI001C5FDE51|nr:MULTISPECIES: CopD family protein [Roseobacteraceae]MBW4963938.1 CopD family protein [Sulfitobacter sp. CW3]|tara:strand:+ start:11174 stop:12022 length:849 start_codon:yes stop_codon:yes gene_type:complete
MPDIWGFAAIITKFALYLGVLTAVGTVTVALVFRLRQYKRLGLVFAVIGLVAAVLSFSLSGANLTGDASGMTDPEMLGLLWSTSVGTALLLRIVGIGLLVVGLFMGRGGLWLASFGGLVAVWSFVLVSHVSTREDVILDVLLAIHLLTAAFWIGILIPLRRLTLTPATWPEAAELGHRFGIVARIALPALVIAGGYIGYVLVGSFAALIGTGYGQGLILKVGLVAALLGLGALNKLRYIPALQAKDPNAAGHLAKSISFEWAVIITVLGTTAVLTTNLTLPT